MMIYMMVHIEEPKRGNLWTDTRIMVPDIEKGKFIAWALGYEVIPGGHHREEHGCCVIQAIDRDID